MIDPDLMQDCVEFIAFIHITALKDEGYSPEQAFDMLQLEEAQSTFKRHVIDLYNATVAALKAQQEKDDRDSQAEMN